MKHIITVDQTLEKSFKINKHTQCTGIYHPCSSELRKHVRCGLHGLFQMVDDSENIFSIQG